MPPWVIATPSGEGVAEDAQIKAPLFPPQPLLLKLPVVTVDQRARVFPVPETEKRDSPLMVLLGAKPRLTPIMWSFVPAVTAPVMLIVNVAEVVVMLKL